MQPHRTLFVPAAFALGGDQRPLTQATQGATHDLFAMAETVNGRGVDPVDAQVQRPVDRASGLLVVLRSPTVRPVPAAHGPGAQTDGRQLKAGLAKGGTGCED